MKLERLHEYVLPIAATLAGMGLAVYCGKLSGNGQMGTLAFIVGASIATALLLGLRQHIWLLLPFGWYLYGQVPVLPLPFSVRDLTVLLVFVSIITLKALKIVRTKPKVEPIDLVVLALLVYMITVFIRNPVGVNALGSERVGGRPYFDVLISILAYWILVRVHVDQKIAPVIPFLGLAAQLFEMSLNALALRLPKIGPYLAAIYTGVDPNLYEGDDVFRPQQEGTGRQGYLAGIGNTLAVICCSAWRPLTAITPLYWGRFALLLTACIAVAFSGFRSGLVAIAAYILISSVIRRGWSDLVPLAAIAVPALVILVGIQGTIVNLPRPVQRTLSFLPGKWDPVAIGEARHSTQWRVEMWKIILTEDKYIDSKWLGDGFGMSKRQLAIMSSSRRIGADGQEDFLVLGNVHSGPISTIRYAGYVGLAIFMLLLIIAARMAWKLAYRAKDTPFFSPALFVTIPIIYMPFAFVFIFGNFDASLPQTIFNIGMLKMLQNSLDAWESAKTQKKSSEVPVRRERRSRRLPEAPVPV